MFFALTIAGLVVIVTGNRAVATWRWKDETPYAIIGGLSYLCTGSGTSMTDLIRLPIVFLQFPLARVEKSDSIIW
jgi:hypothetical protein